MYGINGDGFRHLNYSNKSLKNSKLQPLEQICLFGYDIDEFEKFIEALAWDQYKVAIIKKREYAKSFIDYLWSHQIDAMDDSKVAKLFAQQFPLLDETLDEWEEEHIEIEELSVELIWWKLWFLYYDKEKDTKKTMWVLKWQYVLVSEVTMKHLEWWRVTTANILSKDTYNKTYNEVFGSDNVSRLVQKILKSIAMFSIQAKDIELVSQHIWSMVIVTDKFSSSLENINHMFDLNAQHKVMWFFIEHLEQIFSSIGNRIRNYKFKSVHTEVKHLTTSHLIDDIRLEFTLHKKEDKDLVKLFFWDSAKLNVEKNYEDLTTDQQNIIKDMFIQKQSDRHLYERLYYLPSKRDKFYLHDLEDADVQVRMPSFSPSDLNVNKNEEQKIENILSRISNNKNISDTYNIFYLRNLVGKKWVALRYENIDGEFANFYSDFLFWFINKQDVTDVTIVYMEPKWDGIDKNREKKKEKLEQISSMDVPSEINDLFSNKTVWSNKYTGIKVLWVMQMEY